MTVNTTSPTSTDEGFCAQRSENTLWESQELLAQCWLFRKVSTHVSFTVVKMIVMASLVSKLESSISGPISSHRQQLHTFGRPQNRWTAAPSGRRENSTQSQSLKRKLKYYWFIWGTRYTHLTPEMINVMWLVLLTCPEWIGWGCFGGCWRTEQWMKWDTPSAVNEGNKENIPQTRGCPGQLSNKKAPKAAL